MSSDEWFKYNVNTNHLEKEARARKVVPEGWYLNHSSEDIYQFSFDFFCWTNFWESAS
jgi:hypothetical protein